MTENELQISDTEERKQKIRERYKGADADKIDFIPAKEKESIKHDDAHRRVAVYARVSTDDPNQTSSYELQKNHYTDFVNGHPNWELVEIYADEGISGTSLEHRDSFNRMIKDCEAGKIDVIVTKSVSRFARNIVDCIKIERDLKKLNPPVCVFFETENIYTTDEDCEVLLSIMAMMAQEESHTKSEIMNASIEMRFRRGIFLTPALLGYDRDEDGNLTVNEDEAKIVRLIFYMYLDGYTCQEIADTLTEFGQSTKKGNTVWSPGSILQILQNERHCGDVLARKTWTPNYLDHKSKKNNKDRNQYLEKEHHEAIISRDDFIAVQRMISNAKYGSKGFLPELKVVSDGILKGFVSVNPRWAGFSKQDYYDASDSVGSSASDTSDQDIKAKPGEFDLRGYEVVRAQFMDTEKVSMTFSNKKIRFSSPAVRKFKDSAVELLVQPKKHYIAVKSSNSKNRNSMQCSRMHKGKPVPKDIGGSAFLPMLYQIFGWNEEMKYKVTGRVYEKDDETVLIFDTDDATAVLSAKVVEENESEPIVSEKGNILAYPKSWAESFGDEYYSQVCDSLPAVNGDWNLNAGYQTYKNSDIHPTESNERKTAIASLIDGMKGGEDNG